MVPVIGTTRTVTSSGLAAGSLFPYGTAMRRVGDRLFFVWQETDGSRRVMSRTWRYDLGAFETAATQVFAQAGAAEDVHEFPALGQDGQSRLLLFWPWLGQAALTTATSTSDPRTRAITSGSLSDSSGWGTEGGTPIRAGADLGSWSTPNSALAYDLSVVWNPYSGTGYMVGEVANMGPVGGVTLPGLSWCIWYIGGSGAIDGPYPLILAASGVPSAVSSPGNVFTKAKLFMDRARPGNLTLCWQNRNTFWFSPSTLLTTITSGETALMTVVSGAGGADGGYPTGGGTVRIDSEQIAYASRSANVLSTLTRGVNGTTAAGHTSGANVEMFCQHNYDVYSARSTDGGLVWRSLDGATSFTRDTGVAWDATAYRILQSDSAQGAGQAVAIDPHTGYPFIAYSRYISAGRIVQGHADTARSFTGELGNWDLYVRRWTGAAWVDTFVNAGGIFWSNLDFQTVIGLDGTAVIFAEEPIRYLYSTDRGATWSGLTSIDSESTSKNMQVYVDPLRPHVANLFWSDLVTNAGKWTEITFDSPPQTAAGFFFFNPSVPDDSDTVRFQ